MSGNPTNACGAKEIQVAAKYIVQLCDTAGLAPTKVGLFREALIRALMTKFQGHWWSGKGQAYRYAVLSVHSQWTSSSRDTFRFRFFCFQKMRNIVFKCVSFFLAGLISHRMRSTGFLKVFVLLS
jgi:hypothetical protein